MKAYIARDKDGELFLFRAKPKLQWDTFWTEELYGELEIDNNLFPDLTWEDEPIEVEIYIQKK